MILWRVYPTLLFLSDLLLFAQQKSKQKKRKQDREGEIEELIKKRKRKQLQPEATMITFAQMAGIESLEDVSIFFIAVYFSVFPHVVSWLTEFCASEVPGVHCYAINLSLRG